MGIVDLEGDKELTQYATSSDGSGQGDGEARVTAYFSQYSNVLYTSYDTACETAFSMVEPCLDKGDMLFVIQSNYLKDGYSVSQGDTLTGYGAHSSIVADKNIPFAGTSVSDAGAFAAGSENSSTTGI